MHEHQRPKFGAHATIPGYNPRRVRCRASQRCTAGVMETMRHYGKVPADDELPPQARAAQALVALYQALTAWQHGSVPQEQGVRT